MKPKLGTGICRSDATPPYASSLSLKGARMTENRRPSFEEAVDAMRTLEMVRRHISGFGWLLVRKPKDADGTRGLEVHIQFHVGHERFVNRELLEMVEPAADVLRRALQGSRYLFLDADARPMALRMKAA